MSDELDVSGLEDEERRLGELFAAVQAPDSLRGSYGAGAAGRSRGFRPGRAVGRALIGRPGERRLRPLAAALVIPIAVLAVAGGAGLRAKLGGSSAGSGANPSGRMSAAMAYDAARGEVVMFGGHGASGVLGDTWTWDGSGWTQQHPAESPLPREQAAMAFDPVGGRVILFGGTAPSQAAPLDDTWSWDGSNWRQEHPAHRPFGNIGSLTDHMATDPGRHQVVLTIETYGGGAVAATPVPLAYPQVSHGPGVQSALQTWTWDGTDWSSHGSGAEGALGGNQRLAWDDQLHSVVMLTQTSSCEGFNAVGGSGGSITGSASASVGAVAAPPPHAGPRPAATGPPLPSQPGARTPAATLLPNPPLGQPVQVPMPVSPPMPIPPCLAADAANAAAAASPSAGWTGYTCAGCPIAHLSAWDGRAWHDVTPKSAGPLSNAQLLSADPSSGGVFAWGGSVSWTMQGGDVTTNTTSLALPKRVAAGMVEDPGHRDVLLFGGRIGATFAGDTWTWDGTAWTHRAGAVPPVPTPLQVIPPKLPMDSPNGCQAAYAINKLTTARVGSDAVQITVDIGSASAPGCNLPGVARLADSAGNPLDVKDEWPVSAVPSVFTWRNWCGDPHVFFQVASGNSTTGISLDKTPPCADKTQPSTFAPGNGHPIP